MQTM